MQKLLIAENSETLTNSISTELQDSWNIYACNNGFDASSLLDEIHPEAMIVNLNLQKKDGLTLLKEHFPDLPPVIMALTTFTSQYIEQKASSLGVGCITMLPCKTEYVRDQLEDMMEVYLNPPSKLKQHLFVLGVSPRLKGYLYLLFAVPIYAEDPTQSFTKELYIAVAKECGANDYRCVEKCIRDAVNIAWQHRNDSVWKNYFPPDENGDIKKPTNGDFIAALAERI